MSEREGEEGDSDKETRNGHGREREWVREGLQDMV